MNHEVSTSDLTQQSMDQAAEYRPSSPLTISPQQARIARQAQEYIEKHYDHAVRIEDLCRVTGVGVRTLQRCFKEYFDLTVTEYLKTARLDAARRELRTLRPSQTTVATIALRNGFAHLGRFSIKFRERFGESPNETLAMRANRKSHFR